MIRKRNSSDVLVSSDPTPDLPAALYRDPPADAATPAQTLPQAIPSGGVNLNALLYTATGRGPYPTVLLLHGLPGNEQNLDLAQSMRRAGWNVLTIHYRGSWGGPGSFTFEHCLEDAAAALGWLRASAGDPALKVDANHIVVIGHSMGGFVAAHSFAACTELLGAAMISGVDLGRAFGMPDEDKATARVDENVGISEGLHILAGTSSEALAAETSLNAGRWRLTEYAANLSGRPLLMVTSDDGFAAGSDALAEAVEAIDDACLSRVHLPTDHSYSDRRIELQTITLNWLATIDRTSRRL